MNNPLLLSVNQLIEFILEFLHGMIGLHDKLYRQVRLSMKFSISIHYNQVSPRDLRRYSRELGEINEKLSDLPSSVLYGATWALQGKAVAVDTGNTTVHSVISSY